MKSISLKSINIFLILIIIFAPLRFDFFYIVKYINADLIGGDEYLEITEDTVWDNNTDLSEYEEVDIINNSTLTIEPGSNLIIPNITIFEGRIIAESTIDNKTILKAKDVNIEEIAQEEGVEDEDIEGYDIECFDAGPTITFEADLSAYDQPSIFKHVQFENMGYYTDDDMNCPWSGGIMAKKNRLNIFNDAFASDGNQNPAMKINSGKVEMENVIFESNEYADIEVDISLEEDYSQDSYVKIKNSNFQNNEQNTAVISSVGKYDYDAEDECYDQCYDDCGDQLCVIACRENCRIENNNFFIPDNSKVVLENNWYGHVNGPTGRFKDKEGSTYEILYAGEKVSGNTNVLEHDWRKSADFASNVLFLPGAKASRLYDESNQVWPPTPEGNDYKNILLDEDGNSINNIFTEKPIYEAGLPDMLSPNIYKRFFGDLKSLKDDRIISDYSLYAYDWRMSVDDIAKNGTQYKYSSIKNPISEVMRLADSSVSGKVTIVAHSNGGLLAKTIMIQLEELNMTDKVDNIIMVSSPQMGTPKAILTMLYGYDEKIKSNLIVSDAEAREIAENMPAAYGLLPTEEYFRRVDEPIINFTSEKSEYKKYRDAYGDTINSYQEFKDFLLAKKDNRQKPDKNDVDRANILNEKLFDENKELHEELNNWTPPENVNLIQIGGWGLDTISEINYKSITKPDCRDEVTKEGIKRSDCKDITLESYIPKYKIDGDDIVVTPSSLTLPESENIERYFLDMFSHGMSYFDVTKDRKHADILEIKQLRELLENVILKHEVRNELPKYISNSRPLHHEDMKNPKRLRMALYSPLDIHLYDKDGNHTGPTTDESGNKIIEENIPNSYYDTIGEHKFVGWGSSSDIKVELEGYDAGSYTIELEEVSATETGEQIDAYLTMKNLPTSENTKVSFEIPETGLEDITKLTADYDGDGSNDYEIEPQINGEVTLSENGDTESSNDNKDDENNGDEKNEDEDDDEKENDSNIVKNVLSNIAQIVDSESLRGDMTKQSLEGTAVINEKNGVISQSNNIDRENIKVQNIKNNDKKPIKIFLIGVFLLCLIIICVFIFRRLIK